MADEEKKDNFWLYIGGIAAAVVVLVLMLRGTQGEVYDMERKGISDKKTMKNSMIQPAIEYKLPSLEKRIG